MGALIYDTEINIIKDRQSEEPGALLASFSVCHVSHHTSYTVGLVSGDVLPCRGDTGTSLGVQADNRVLLQVRSFRW